MYHTPTQTHSIIVYVLNFCISQILKQTLLSKGDSRSCKMAQWVKSLVMQVSFPRTYCRREQPSPQSCPQTTHMLWDTPTLPHIIHPWKWILVSEEATVKFPMLLAAICLSVTCNHSKAKLDNQSENACDIPRRDLKNTFVSRGKLTKCLLQATE